MEIHLSPFTGSSIPLIGKYPADGGDEYFSANKLDDRGF